MRRYYSKSSKINGPFSTDIDIDNLSKDAKLKTHYYHVSQYTSTPLSGRHDDSNNQQDFNFTSGKSLNRLRQKTRQQMNFRTSLGNKMSYFSTALDRQKQVVTLAKKKYEKIIQVRSSSMAQKKQLSKEREKLRRREMAKASMKASAVRMERKNSYQNMELLRAKKQEIAIKLKNNTANNQKIIAQKEEEELSKKKEIVVELKKSSQVGREYLHRYYQQKVLRGKKDHSKKLANQQQQSFLMKMRNMKTYTFFKQKAEQFKKQRQQYDHELSQYEKVLGKYIGFRKTKSNNSFYITN